MKKAFTLIELIVVVGIISIVAGITIASLNSQSNQKELQKEAEKLVSVLSLAEKKAAAGYSCANFKGYRVTLTTTASTFSYTLDRLCNTTYTTEGTFTSESPIILSTSPTNSTGTIFFKPVQAGTLLDSNESLTEKNIYVKNPAISGSNQCMMINVQKQGRLYLTDEFDTCN